MLETTASLITGTSCFGNFDSTSLLISSSFITLGITTGVGWGIRPTASVIIRSTSSALIRGSSLVCFFTSVATMLEITSSDSLGLRTDWCFCIKATINASSTGLIWILATLFVSYCWIFSWSGWSRPSVSNWNWEITSFKVMMSWCCSIKSCFVWVSWLTARLNWSLVTSLFNSLLGTCWITFNNFWYWSSRSCWIWACESVWLCIILATSVDVISGPWFTWGDELGISPSWLDVFASVVSFLKIEFDSRASWIRCWSSSLLNLSWVEDMDADCNLAFVSSNIFSPIKPTSCLYWSIALPICCSIFSATKLSITSRFKESYLINSSLIRVVTWSLELGSSWAISVAIVWLTCCWIRVDDSSCGLVSSITGVSTGTTCASAGKDSWTGCVIGGGIKTCFASNSWRRIKPRILSLSWITVCLALKRSDFSGNDTTDDASIIGVRLKRELVSTWFDGLRLTGEIETVGEKILIWLGMTKFESSSAMMVSSFWTGIIKPCCLTYGLRTESITIKTWKMNVSSNALTTRPENAIALNPGFVTWIGNNIKAKKSVFVPKLSNATASWWYPLTKIKMMDNEKTNAIGETMILNSWILLMAFNKINIEAREYNNTANHCNPLKRLIEEKSINGETVE